MIERLELLITSMAARALTIDEVVEVISLLMQDAVGQVNHIFAPRQLIKKPRRLEPLPIEKAQFSSYRTRMGTILEYAFASVIDARIKSIAGDNLRLTFVPANQYPDFAIRDANLDFRIGVEMKAVDVESEEQAARFEVLKGLIEGDRDVVLIVGWKWTPVTLDATEAEYPTVLAFVVVPAMELASERDQSVNLRGGRVDEFGITVPSRKDSKSLVRDQGNAGKVLRLVHATRKENAFELSAHIRAYLAFIEDLKSHI